MYQVTKTYGNDRGLSCVFRQWKASTHCSKLHGYSLGFAFTFGCKKLDERGWVLDFGALDGLKTSLEANFDHKLVIAKDDPELYGLMGLKNSVCDIVILEAVGCEAFARFGFELASQHLQLYSRDRPDSSCFIHSVRCFEHGANSSTYIG